MVTEIKFGTDGFRGIIADNFTFENVERITRAIASYILKTGEQKTVLIGYDPRFMADKFAHFCASILKNFGFKVFVSSKVVPTPVLAYAATVAKDCAGAIMLTASHNPKEYLGIKFIPNYGGPATKGITDEIVSLIDKTGTGFENGAEGSINGSITEVDFSEEYFSHLEKIIDFNVIKKAQPKFIYDGLYSASIGYFDEILKRRGINFEAVNLHHDPDFGGGLPEPKQKFMKHTKPGFLTFANDGDADRYGVIDEKGEYVSPNIVMAILLKYLVSKNEGSPCGKMIKTVGVSGVVDIAAEKLNVETITTPVGFKWLSEKMRENDTILAGEDSGGLSTGGHIPEKDGIYANLLILEAISALNKPLWQLKEEITEFTGASFIQDRVDIHLDSDAEKQVLIEKFSSYADIAGFRVYETLKVDGVKLFLKDEDGKQAGWVLIRESGTEPLLRFYIETSTEEDLEKIKSFISQNAE